MKYEKLIKQLLVSIIGNILLGLGIALTSKANLGVDVTIAFSSAMSSRIGVTLGQMTAITNAVLVAIVLLVYPKNIGLGTVLVAFGNQYPLDFFNMIIPSTDVFVIRVLLLIAGIVIIGLGASVIIASNLGMGIYEAFVFAFSKRFEKNYVLCKYACDSIFLIMVLILRGPLGIGTIASYALTGICIDYFNKTIGKQISFN